MCGFLNKIYSRKRMFSRVGKICQRRLYTWLSSRCGIPVLVVGALVALISLLQFGGVSDGV